MLWFALLSATFMFFGVLFVVVSVPPTPPDFMLLPVFAFVAVTTLAMSEVVPRMAYVTAAKNIQLETTEEAVADPGRSASDVLPFRETNLKLRKVASKPAEARRRALAIYQTQFILKMAMAEAVALFGFVVRFLGFPLVYALPFFVACWIAMLLRFPSLEKALVPFERALGVHVPRT